MPFCWVLGKTGRGVPEYCGVLDRVDIITGTLGKALGVAMSGYTTGKKRLLKNAIKKSRPYLFSNSLAPSIVGASLKVFDLLNASTDLRDKLEENTRYFKEKKVLPLDLILESDSPIVPIMLYDAALSQELLIDCFKRRICHWILLSVCCKGAARIRTQISAAHSKSELDKAIDAFVKIGKELNVIS